jgi:NAD(P)-dependent dehydrogenase (short-subunit alcohol dehydrogenase family)
MIASTAFKWAHASWDNAGTGDPTGEFLELPYEEWRQDIDANLSGAFLCAQRAARRMVDAQNGGRIVNITPSTSASRAPVPPRTAHRREGSAY